VPANDLLFGITTAYHVNLVPLTTGLSVLAAVMRTAWLVKKDHGSPAAGPGGEQHDLHPACRLGREADPV
jgi:hypothetical protein